jgi:hypothetical protein
MGVNLPMTHPATSTTITPSQIALFGDTDPDALATAVDVRDNVNVQDSAGTGFGIVANGGAGVVNLAAGCDTGAVWSLGNVVVAGGAVIHGALRTNGTASLPPSPPNPDPVTGSEFTGSGTGLTVQTTTINGNFPTLPATPLFHNGGTATISPGTFGDITVNAGTLTINPGSYGNLTVNDTATVVLNGTGTYTFLSFTFSAGAALQVSGTIQVHMRNSMNFAATVNTVNPALYRFAVFTGGVTLGPPNTTNTFRGTVVAMNGSVMINGTRIYRGAFFGRTVTVQPGCTIQQVAFGSWELPS